MKNEELIKSLENSIYISRGNKIQKIKSAMLRMIFSKMLTQIAVSFKKSFKVKAKTFWDEEMLVIIPEVVSLSIYRYGFFEEDLTKMVLEYLKPGMTFFDIGAHFGYYTLLASFIVGNKGRVHAFEPTPSSFAILKTNTLNKHNIVLNNLAVFSEKGNVLINDYGVRYSAYNSIYTARLSKNIISVLKPLQYNIEVISIDEYIENNNIRPDFIKIDAESSEYKILLGMRKTINNFHPIISLEVGDMSIEGVPTSKSLIEFLINGGYRPYELKGDKIQQHILTDEPYTYRNLLFLPE